jgi:hypothetical protein
MTGHMAKLTWLSKKARRALLRLPTLPPHPEELRSSVSKDEPGCRPHGSPGDTWYRPETALARLLTMRVKVREFQREALRLRPACCAEEKTDHCVAAVRRATDQAVERLA